MVVSLCLMGVASQYWVPGVYVLAYVGGFVVAEYDDGTIRTRKAKQEVL